MIDFNGTSIRPGVILHIDVCIFGLIDWFGLVWFYDISAILGYLMLNPFLYA